MNSFQRVARSHKVHADEKVTRASSNSGSSNSSSKESVSSTVEANGHEKAETDVKR